MQRRFFVFFVWFSCFFSSLKALSGDSTQISLLTVMPRSNEVYTVFGHTALRVCNPSAKMDVVFNYGTFDFHSPGFMYRFAKGETDYFLSTAAYGYFRYVYTLENSKVIEQVLDIPVEDKEAMVKMLLNNLQPENREYRYNFVFDNCTTRPRDIIEQFCGGTILYPEQKETTTFRKLIHSCTDPYPWLTFGIDLVIGSGADSLVGIRQEMFLPAKLMHALDGASVADSDSQRRALVLSSEVVIDAQKENSSRSEWWVSPTSTGVALLCVSLVFAIGGWIWKRKFRAFFGSLFLLAGLAGCVVAFMSFVSSHPCVCPNWNLLWLHPLHLIAFIGCCFKKSYPLIRWYHGSNFVLLSVLLLGWHWVPQELNPACIPYVLSLWVASGYSLLSVKRQKYE